MLNTTDPDAMSKDELIRELCELTGNPSERFANCSIRELRATVVVSRNAKPKETVVQQNVALTEDDIERLVERVTARTERNVMQRLREMATVTTSPSGDSETDSEDAPVRIAFKSAAPITIPSGDYSFDVKRDPHYRNPFPDMWSRWEKMSRDTGDIINIGLTGATGTGKTTFAMQFAAHTDRPCVIVDCGGIVEPEQYLGTWVVDKDGDASVTHFVPSALVAAIQMPDAVIILDELNRTGSPKANNILAPLLDKRRYLDVPTIGRVHVAAGVFVFATLNEGVGYTGTDELDSFLKSRFARTVPITYPENEVEILRDSTGCSEELARGIVRLANNLRGEYDAISLRTLQACAEEVIYGAPLDEAIFMTFARIAEPEIVKKAAIATFENFTINTKLYGI